MGVFVPVFSLNDLDLGLFSLSSSQQLFLLGALAIAAGIFTYSKKVMETIGSNIVELTSEAALVVVLAESLVLFIFSSSELSSLFVRIGLPPIPMVPVSSSQVVVGCVMGIGLYKGLRNINFRLLGEIATGWLATPILSGVLSFFSLFFMKNIFNIEVGSKITENGPPAGIQVHSGAEMSDIIKYLLLGIIATGLITVTYFFLLERKRRRELRQSDEKFWKNLK
jgi:inorganic phosphate transporter, PiT family